MATRKTTTRKKTAEKPAIVIDEDIEIGMLELPDSKGIRVALIRSAGKPITPSIATYTDVAAAMHVSVAELMEKVGEKNEGLPELNARDERDIQKKLQSILDDLDPDTGLAFYNGQEPMDNETRDLIRSSIENSLRTAKQLAKTKYTPKNYRNE